MHYLSSILFVLYSFISVYILLFQVAHSDFTKVVGAIGLITVTTVIALQPQQK